MYCIWCIYNWITLKSVFVLQIEYSHFSACAQGLASFWLNFGSLQFILDQDWYLSSPTDTTEVPWTSFGTWREVYFCWKQLDCSHDHCMHCFLFGKMTRSTMENKEWLSLDSFETEETKMKTKAWWCKTLDEIMALYSNDRSTVNISKPSTLSSTIGVDKAVISEVKPVSGIFDTMRENSADGHTQNTNHQNVIKWRLSWSKWKSKFHDNKYFDQSWRSCWWNKTSKMVEFLTYKSSWKRWWCWLF